MLLLNKQSTIYIYIMKTKYTLFASLVVFVALLFILPHPFIPSDLGNTILTITTFLFGLMGGFYIVVTTTDYNSLKNTLATETAGWISLYTAISIYDKSLLPKLSNLIDSYIIRAFDYEIIDYAKGTNNEFTNIENMVRNIQVIPELSSVHQEFFGAINDITVARQQMTVLGTKSLSIFQWFVLFILGILLVTSLYGLRSGELFFDIVTVAVSCSVVLILLLIRELDLYIWNEKTFGYDIFENVLKSIGQRPYYPEETIKDGRIHPVEKEYRVGIALNPYDFTAGRKIETRLC